MFIISTQIKKSIVVPHIPSSESLGSFCALDFNNFLDSLIAENSVRLLGTAILI